MEALNEGPGRAAQPWGRRRSSSSWSQMCPAGDTEGGPGQIWDPWGRFWGLCANFGVPGADFGVLERSLGRFFLSGPQILGNFIFSRPHQTPGIPCGLLGQERVNSPNPKFRQEQGSLPGSSRVCLIQLSQLIIPWKSSPVCCWSPGCHCSLNSRGKLQSKKSRRKIPEGKFQKENSRRKIPGL